MYKYTHIHKLKNQRWRIDSLTLSFTPKPSSKKKLSDKRFGSVTENRCAVFDFSTYVCFALLLLLDLNPLKSELLTKQACRDELVVYSLFFSQTTYIIIYMCVFYIDTSVLLETMPLLQFIQNHIWDLRGIFSILFLTSWDIDGIISPVFHGY